MRNINKHIIHCSDSTFGDVKEIRRWHMARGWRDIGYHFVILPSGKIESGRPFSEVGAHVRGHNTSSVGTCLIGVDEFTSAQFGSLNNLHVALQSIFPNLQVFGHRDFDKGKTCPNFEVEDILTSLNEKLT